MPPPEQAAAFHFGEQYSTCPPLHSATSGRHGRWLDRNFRPLDIPTFCRQALHEGSHGSRPQGLAHLPELLHFLGGALSPFAVASDPDSLFPGHVE
jgi:hypothetical protein